MWGLEYGCAPGNMVAPAMAAHPNKKYCSEAYESNNMVASAMAAHHNKKYGSEAYESNVGPPMVVLLEIWLHSYVCVHRLNMVAPQ
jgi:hypothetical protein